jgi:Flp pilus assembly protein TadD
MRSGRREMGWIIFSGLALIGLAAASYGQINTIPDSQSQTGLGGQNQIVGTVFGPSGRPVDRPFQIKLMTMMRGNRTSMTTETGHFAFKGLPTGTYTILLENEKDFETYTQTVDVRQFRGTQPQVVNLTVQLVARTRASAKPAVVNAEFANVPPRAQEYYFQAVEKSRNGDRAGAIVLLMLAIKEHPAFMYAYNELGVQYLRSNRLTDADEAFQKALTIEPGAFSPLMNRGIATFMMKRYGEAVPILRKAVQKNSQSPVGHYFLGQALANLGLFDAAERELIASLDLGKEEMKEAHRILAIIYGARGDKKKAADNLESYLQLAPTAPDAEKLRATLRQLRETS